LATERLGRAFATPPIPWMCWARAHRTRHEDRRDGADLPWLAEQGALFDGALQTAWDRLLAPAPCCCFCSAATCT
jgi:hypothetical protein